MTRRSIGATILAWVAAVTLLAPGAAAAPPKHLWSRNDFPIPPERPGRVFFLQRSMNSNTVVYEARLGPGGRLDPAQPLVAYWLRFNTSGERRPLTFVEEHLAFGPVLQRDPRDPGAWIVRAAGYPARSARLVLDRHGVPALLGEVAGRPARLVSGYLELDGKGYLPGVRAVDLYGIDLATGAWLHERFVP